jgi:hypothetical protein
VSAMPEPLSTLDVNLLVKIAAIVFDDDLIDRDATDYRAVDLMRRCSEAMADGHVVQIAIPGDALIRGLAGEPS